MIKRVAAFAGEESAGGVVQDSTIFILNFASLYDLIFQKNTINSKQFRIIIYKGFYAHFIMHTFHCGFHCAKRHIVITESSSEPSHFVCGCLSVWPGCLSS